MAARSKGRRVVLGAGDGDHATTHQPRSRARAKVPFQVAFFSTMGRPASATARHDHSLGPSGCISCGTASASRSSAREVMLSLGEIEEINGVPLSVTATVSPAWWVSESGRLARDLWGIGWRARLHVKQRVVTFRRIDAAKG